MLNSCAPGVTVVNIDNGYGAGVFAARVARRRPHADAATTVTVWVDASVGRQRRHAARRPARRRRPLDVLQDAVDAVAPEPVTLRAEPVTRNGFAATRCHVEVADSATTAPGATSARCCAPPTSTRTCAPSPSRVFERLAVAEARVHGTDPLDVAFHEVGALDAIADVVGRLRRLRRTSAPADGRRRPVAVGSGTVRGAHGTLPVPPPAVAELLRGVPSYAGPAGRARHGAVHARPVPRC